jgi:hypothetical protein
LGILSEQRGQFHAATGGGAASKKNTLIERAYTKSIKTEKKYVKFGISPFWFQRELQQLLKGLTNIIHFL